MSVMIFVGGTKGGSGKSLTSHMLALGAILAKQPAACVLTDPERELRAAGRPYSVIDGKDPDRLAEILTTSQSVQNGWWFVDGGGNRPAFDQAVAAQCTLCLVPFRDSREDIQSTLKSLERIPNSFAWPTAWPTNAHARQWAQRYIDAVAKEFPMRVISPPIMFVNSAKELLEDELGNPSTEVRSEARRAFSTLTDWCEAYVASHAKPESKIA